MINAMLVALTVLIIPDIEINEFAQTYRIQESSNDFLQSAQIKTLLVGTRFSHRPPGVPGKVSLTFKANGRINIVNPRGRRSTGYWKISDPGVLCLEKLGGGGDKNFCALVTRTGNQVYHYNPKTGQRIDTNPWIIE